jgi:hypothetical protein
MQVTIWFLITAMSFSNNQAEMLRTSSRKLSFGLIAGFEPSSLVTDHVSYSRRRKIPGR